MDYSLKCFICERKFVGSLLAQEVKIVKASWIATLREYSMKIGDNKHKFLEGKTEIQVHEKCRTKYLISNKDTPGSSNSSVSGISTRSVSSDFDSECQFTIGGLLKIMEYKPSPKTLITHLESHFGTDVTISGTGIKSIVTYCGSGDLPVDDMWYMHREQRKEDEDIRVIRTAAELIRKQIKSTQYKTKTYPSSVSFLDNVHADIPKYLDEFWKS
ncbi:hypothetical protein KQX54_006038 [Cotesia glomerata]|uniref:Uncharacterized protein n=1 Tax=Cotesia glomerata TaxID=32391 RepID=A0AAV7IJK0_COTGL|nr:hypothetical protein KQX54_006038 [Cotesia glomerata]